jgi:alkanesulfonate monooxygenase SsuD/methylene tetrahydromethanopterin reductase-like flavin-dependent oxidoreductase (luciferase family)
MMRFDMRSPAGGAATDDLYAAALEMAAWGEEHGAAAAVLSEHHASEDGYLPSPILLATAIAARTTHLPISIAALLVPLHDPVRLAEDMAVADVITRGRISYVAGLGYRPEEYAMFGQSLAERGRRMETSLAVLRQAWTGEELEYEGRTVRVTPCPYTPGGPPLLYGGGTAAAARRAARFGLSFLAQAAAPGLEQTYRDECARHGVEPGMCIIPAVGSATSVFVADDVDEGWARYGPHMLHDARMYASWLGATDAASKSVAPTVDAMRAEAGAYRVLTPTQAVDYVREFGLLPLHPLCGGCPPDDAWRSLHLVASAVLPALG